MYFVHWHAVHALHNIHRIQRIHKIIVCLFPIHTCTNSHTYSLIRLINSVRSAASLAASTSHRCNCVGLFQEHCRLASAEDARAQTPQPTPLPLQLPRRPRQQRCCPRTCVNASATDRSAWRADASAKYRCDCTWPGNTGTSSAERCASDSGASDSSPLCRSCDSATLCPDRVRA